MSELLKKIPRNHRRNKLQSNKQPRNISRLSKRLPFVPTAAKNNLKHNSTLTET